MGILNSIKSIFKKEEPPVPPKVKIDTKIKRKELQIGDMLEGRYEIRDIKEGGRGSVYIIYLRWVEKMENLSTDGEIIQTEGLNCY